MSEEERKIAISNGMTLGEEQQLLANVIPTEKDHIEIITELITKYIELNQQIEKLNKTIEEQKKEIFRLAGIDDI